MRRIKKMTRQRMVDLYSQYYGTTKREARERVGLILKNLTPEKATRYFKAVEDALHQEAYSSFYAD